MKEFHMSEKILSEILLLKDTEYRDFSADLVPNIDKERVIGVRVPKLRLLAKSMDAVEREGFLKELPHKYFEENNLHAMIINEISDPKQCLSEIEAFLPYIDNWATCDSLRPKCFNKHLDILLPHIKKWINSEHTYTCRFGIEMLMIHYLGEAFSHEYPNAVSRIRGEDYYIRMMIAWYFATALACRWDDIIGYIENKSLPTWTHNKAIQKAVESNRLNDAQKLYLKRLKI